MLKQKFETKHLPITLFEVIPPPGDISHEDALASAQAIAELIQQLSDRVDALNIPEVRPESRSAPRPRNYIEKMPPRRFATYLKKVLPPDIDIIINRCVVYAPKPAQIRWFQTTNTRYEIEYVVLVGGESSSIRYPGPSVVETARWIRDYLNEGKHPFSGKPTRKTHLIPGGITIPTRRHPSSGPDEPERLYIKSMNGIQFFTSQILYESQAMKNLLADYSKLCEEKNVEPARIFLSFAPVSSKRDLDFLKWLGVEIPPSVEKEILGGWHGKGLRSIHVAKRVLEEILELYDSLPLKVPLGLNVEHVTMRNFELSGEMIEELTRVINRTFSFGESARSDQIAEQAIQLSSLPFEP